jgi:hypothetical protein
MNSQEMDTETLFTQYLNTLNAAIDKHATEFPYKQLIKAGDKALHGRNLGVAIYKDDPGKPHDYYTIRFENGHVEYVTHGKDKPAIAWKAKREYLEKVVDHPGDYIEHPSRLDIDWLKTRAGLH